MDFKNELKYLVKCVKEASKKNGAPLRNEDIAMRLGKTRTYLSDLIGPNSKAEVTETHVIVFKEKFKAELADGYVPQIDDNLNPERALMIAMIEDYIDWKAAVTGVPPEKVKELLKKKSNGALARLHSWLPGKQP